MTGHERDCDEALSRALHSAMDEVEPAGDGLTKIQTRLAEPWLKRQWWLLRSELTVLGWVLAVRCQSWFSTLRSGSAAGVGAGDVTADHAGTATGAPGNGVRRRSLAVLGGITAWAQRQRKAGAPLRRSVGPAMAWLRPALAVAGAVVLVVAGVFALGQLRGTFISIQNDNAPGTTATSSSGGGPGTTNGHGGRAGQRGQQSSSPGGGTSARPGSRPSDRVLFPSPAAHSPAGAPQVASPSPSPSPANASPTATPTTPTATPTTPTSTPSISAAPMSPAPGGG